MQEKNKHILEDLLRQLPVYEPADAVWEGIEQNLTAPLSAGLKRLPLYDPPDEVWDRIEAELQKTQAKQISIRRVLPWLSGAAAALAGIIWFFSSTPRPDAPAAVVTVSYSREIVDDALLLRDWEQDEEAFKLVEKLCASSPFTCTNPDMNTLRTELDELTDAKLALQEALGTYGTDADLIGQLTEIERQRTALLKRMLEYFI